MDLWRFWLSRELSVTLHLSMMFSPRADVPLPLKTLLMINQGRSYDVGEVSRSTVNNSWFFSGNWWGRACLKNSKSEIALALSWHLSHPTTFMKSPRVWCLRLKNDVIMADLLRCPAIIGIFKKLRTSLSIITSSLLLLMRTIKINPGHHEKYCTLKWGFTQGSHLRIEYSELLQCSVVPADGGQTQTTRRRRR